MPRKTARRKKAWLGIAPRPFVPSHWQVPHEYPSDHIYVDDESGDTSEESAPGYGESGALKKWRDRQQTREWACERLTKTHGATDALRRCDELWAELMDDEVGVESPNEFMEVLVAITFEDWWLAEQAEAYAQLCQSISQDIKQDAKRWRAHARRLEEWGRAAAKQAHRIATSLESLAKDPTIRRPRKRQFRSRHAVAPYLGPDPSRINGKIVWASLDYKLLSSKPTNPDINWLLAEAVKVYLHDQPDATKNAARKRVAHWLYLLDCSFSHEDAQVGARRIASRTRGFAS